MATTVELPGGEIAEFPDDMPEDQIHAAVKKHLAPKEAPVVPTDLPLQRIVQYDQQESDRQSANLKASQKVHPSKSLAEPQSVPEILEQSANTPALQALVKPETREKIRNTAIGLALAPTQGVIPEGKAKQALTGAVEGAADLAESFTSPIGLAATLVKAPVAIQRLLSAAFAYSSGKGVVDEMKPLAEAIQNEDWKTAARLGVGILGGTAIAATAGAHALKPEAAVPPRIDTKPPVIGEASAVPESITKFPGLLKEAEAEANKSILEQQTQPAKGGESDASGKQKTTEVHGDLRTPAIEGEGKVPVEEGGGGIQPQPEAKGALALTEDVKSIEGMDQNSFAEEMTKRGSLTPAAYDLGLSVTDLSHLEELKQAGERVKSKGKEAMAKGDFNVAAPELMKGQFFREAYEAATGTGSAGKALREKDPNYQPPFPEGKPKEVISGGKEEKEKARDEGVLNQPPAGVSQALAGVNARVISPHPIKESYNDQHSISIQVANTGTEGFSDEQIKKSLPENIRGDLSKIRRFKGELVPTNPKVSVPGRIELVFKDKAAAQKALDHLKGGIVDRPVNNQKYRVGNSPQTHEIVERLPQSETEKANGEQPVRVKSDRTGEVQTVMEGDLTAVKSRPSKLKQSAQSLGAGPGAATRPGSVTATDIGSMETNIPPLEKLADAVSRFPKQAGAGFQERLKQWMDEVGIPTKDFFTRAVVGAKAATAKIVDAFTKLPAVTTMDRAVGRWNLEDTEGDLAARRFSNAVKTTFPDRSKLRALSNWINAAGDKDLLRRQADLTKDPALKKTYEDALKFGSEEEKLAREVQQYHDEMLSTAMQAGALEEGVENYLHRYFPRENDPTRQKIEAALNNYRFTKNFAGFKKRFYDSDFEAEQAGLKPEKDASKRILAYDQGFRKALTARAFVKDRYSASMPDGRPEIDVAGVGVPTGGDVAAGEKGAYLIKPKARKGGDSPEDYRGDYVTFDHPAFRKWKWVGSDANGKPILMEGEMSVHPDAVKKYKALFERSWFQKNPVGRALLVPSNFVKQTMLAISGFHPVQIGIHAIEHKVNPFKLTDLNVRDPAQAELVEGGLVVSDLGGGSHFDEGVSGSGLFGKLPVVGEKVKATQDWLFKDFIPRVKMTMALEALKRNLGQAGPLSGQSLVAKDYKAGKITREQVVRLTARESNAAFGEQNYRAMFRHPGFQDLLRFAFLAPDFGEARLRFPAQALTKYGGEQRMALVLGAVGMAVMAKTVEKMLTGKTNMSPSHIFSVGYNGKEYGLRNVASDLMHMVTDPAGYLRNRLNPIYTRAALEALSGRDAFGRKRSPGQQVLDEAKQIVPISGRGMVEKDQKLWESFVNAIGLTEHRKSAFSDVMKDINKWKDKKGYTSPGEFVYDSDKDPYVGITRELTSGSLADVRKQLDKLTEGKTPLEVGKIAQHYRKSLMEHRFLTGSRVHEQEYLKGLNPAEKQQYDEAKAERMAMWQKFVKAWRSKYPSKAE